MARQEADRDDLWAEAVAMTDRVELTVPNVTPPVLVGYRPNGWCSFYVGPGVMLQFTPAGGLRRAYRNGQLYRTQGQTLAGLRRERSEKETLLLRQDLTADELAEFRAWTHGLLQCLLNEIESRRVNVLRETTVQPEPLLDRIVTTLKVILAAEVFLAPPINPARS